jgi:hypothetical protein
LTIYFYFAGDIQETTLPPPAGQWNNTMYQSQNGGNVTTFVWYHRTMAAYPPMPDVDGYYYGMCVSLPHIIATNAQDT